jgi:glucokinase
VHAVVGPGTGLGVAALLRDATGERVLETEGGHATFAAETAEELEIARLLGARFGRVSWERVLCGNGLANLYNAVATMAGDAPDARVTPEEVTRRADADADRHCVRAVEVFCALLGAFAGDVALNYGAWDGVFIGGGIPGRLARWLEPGGFRRRFDNKGRFSARLASIPVALIGHPFPGLLGAARRALAGSPAAAP